MDFKKKRFIVGGIIVAWGLIAVVVMLNTARQLPEETFSLKSMASQTPEWAYFSCAFTTGVSVTFDLVPNAYSSKFMITFFSIQLFIYTLAAQILSSLIFKKPETKTPV